MCDQSRARPPRSRKAHSGNRITASPNAQWVLNKHVPTADEQRRSPASAIYETLLRVPQQVDAFDRSSLEVGELCCDSERHEPSGQNDDPAATHAPHEDQQEETTPSGREQCASAATQECQRVVYSSQQNQHELRVAPRPGEWERKANAEQGR